MCLDRVKKIHCRVFVLSIQLEIWLFHMGVFWIKQLRKLQKCKLTCGSLLFCLLAFLVIKTYCHCHGGGPAVCSLVIQLLIRVLYLLSLWSRGAIKVFFYAAPRKLRHTQIFFFPNPKYHLYPVNLVQTRILQMTCNQCVKSSSSKKKLTIKMLI